MKIIASKIAPNPKEAQLWIDLSEDPQGGVTKHRKGNKWVAVNNKPDGNDGFNAEVFQALKEMSNKIEELSKEISAQHIEIDNLSTANSNIIKRINKLEQFIVTE